MLHIMAGMREWNDFIYNEISASYQPFPFFKNNTTIINNWGGNGGLDKSAKGISSIIKKSGMF